MPLRGKGDKEEKLQAASCLLPQTHSRARDSTLSPCEGQPQAATNGPCIAGTDTEATGAPIGFGEYQSSLSGRVRFGLDIGSISLRLAVLGEPGHRELFDLLPARSGSFRALPQEWRDRCPGPVVVSETRRIRASPLESARALLAELTDFVPATRSASLQATGAAGRLLARQLGGEFENEFKAIARAIRLVHPEVRTVFEIGGASSKYVLLSEGGNTGALGIEDYSTNGECAAGTGSFLDQQASRLQYRVEEIGEVACGARCAARIAGRCSVFAKSDMIHAQQKGYSTGEILQGLCEAVARNFKSSIVKGRRVVPPVAFIGGVASNRAVCEALRQAFKLDPGEFFVPALHDCLGALGAVLLGEENVRGRRHYAVSRTGLEGERAAWPPLTLEGVVLLRDRIQSRQLTADDCRLRSFLGIDIGSVSTNLAVLDTEGRLLHEIYLRTVGRPIEVVHQGLQEIQHRLGDRLDIAGVGTTGSGRELIGELVGADMVNDEITAHKTGALFISTTMLGEAVDTIFEIGGQDSKFIALEDSVVVDFAMNEACAAGTGSFLEEQAERMGIQIQGEFARLALSSTCPARLGERCTVFMERDVTSYLQNGFDKADLAAGLAYSIALNYLNRVVRGRKLGRVIYFQGGTAYNDAVAAAFSHVLGQRIIVPPYNGVMGAIGMALIAREWAQQHARPSSFRGFDLQRTRFQTREFVCKACSNYCEMKEITVEGRKSYWGDKCSDKFRKRARTEHTPVIPDLLALRDAALLDAYRGPQGSGPTVGIPRAMYCYDQFPFWHRYLAALGFAVVLSDPTDSRCAAQGVEACAAEPCFPVQIAHGHVKQLLEAGVEYVLLPNVVDQEAPASVASSRPCPWNQTLPFVIRAAASLASPAERWLAPTVHFRSGPARVKKELGEYFGRLGISRRRSDAAVELAYAAQSTFQQRLLEAGREAVALLDESRQPAILLVGRPYNLYDRNSNCDLPRKLRALYGVNVLPLDFLPLDETTIADINPNMFWHSGRRILAAGRMASARPLLHVLYLTNFKCGPDSILKHFLRPAVGAPLLVLQFDGHGNDTGYLTRCEAYLDSKGFLR